MQEELLVDLTGKNAAEIRRDLPGGSDEIYFLYEIVGYLQGSYDRDGIRRWFQRERSQLEGKSPLQYLGRGWSPEEEKAKQVLELARSLVYPEAT